MGIEQVEHQNPLEIGPSAPNHALLDVYECVKRLSEDAAIGKNEAGQFLVFSNNQIPVDINNPTPEEVLSAVNLSLALKEANWAYFHLDHKIDKETVFHYLEKLNKNTLSTTEAQVRNFSTGSLVTKPDDARKILRAEIEAMEYYTGGSYSLLNTLLRGLSTYKAHQSESGLTKINLNKIKEYLVNALLGMHGAGKNRLVTSVPETETNPTSEAINSNDITHNKWLIRLLSDVPPGLRAALSSITGQPIVASGFQSWTHFEKGSPDIQRRKVIRLKMEAQGQRPLYDYFGEGSEGEVLFPATHYRVCKVELGEHINPHTNAASPIVDVTVERVWGVATELSDFYYTLDALSVAYHNHLRHPYKKMPDYQDHGVNRPNHALAHHVRATRNVDYVVDYFAAHAEPKLKKYCKNLSLLDREKLRVFMAFSRVGRESEDDFSSDPETYKLQLKASADHFKSFALSRSLMKEEEANLWCRVLQDMGNPLFDRGIDEDLDEILTSEQKETAKNLHAIFNLAHKLDLPRCFTKDEYTHAVFPYKPMTGEELSKSHDPQESLANLLIPYTEEARAAFESMEEFAQGCIIATGENMTHSWAREQRRNPEVYKTCNTSILDCWDACDSVALANQIASTVKPFLDKLDKILLNPIIYKLYQQLTQLSVADFPTDATEMEQFLTCCFSTKPPIGITNANRPSLFQDVDILIYILQSNAISDGNKKSVLSEIDISMLQVTTADKLINLLKCSELRALHSAIIDAQAGRWQSLVKSHKDLITLLNCSALKDEHQTIINAQAGRWKELVTYCTDLSNLLNCLELKNAHPDIIDAQTERWQELVKSQSDLIILLNCPALIDKHPNIIKAQEKQWHKIVTSCSDLTILLNYSQSSALKDMHQTIINAQAGRWRELVQSPQNLNILLLCSALKDSHQTIIKAQAGRWRDLVKSPDYLRRLLNNPALKSARADQDIINDQAERWHELVKSPKDLTALLSFSALKSISQVIIKAQAGRWHELVETTSNLIELLNCLALESAHPDIIDAQTGQWRELVKSNDDLLELFRRSALKNAHQAIITAQSGRHTLILDTLRKINTVNYNRISNIRNIVDEIILLYQKENRLIIKSTNNVNFFSSQADSYSESAHVMISLLVLKLMLTYEALPESEEKDIATIKEIYANILNCSDALTCMNIIKDNGKLNPAILALQEGIERGETYSDLEKNMLQPIIIPTQDSVPSLRRD